MKLWDLFPESQSKQSALIAIVSLFVLYSIFTSYLSADNMIKICEANLQNMREAYSRSNEYSSLYNRLGLVNGSNATKVIFNNTYDPNKSLVWNSR